VATAALLLAGALGTATPARAATAVGLGAADSFAVLAGAGITNTGPTTLTGDTGTFPTTSVTGGGSITQTGTAHGGDAVTQQAKTDLVTAYDSAAGQGPPTALPADPSGSTLVPGVYTQAVDIGLTGTLTLDAGGNPSSVFVLQAGRDLITASGSSIQLVGGAQACNVFWQVGASTTLGTGSLLRGTVLSLTSITAQTSAVIEGRLLARNGAVTLDSNTITRPGCVTSTPTTTAGPTSTPAPSPTPGPTAAPTTTPAPTPAPTTAPAPGTTTSPVTGGGTGSSTGGRTTGSGSYSQVDVVPVGSVDTGDGSTA
jgi:hypothetical protein